MTAVAVWARRPSGEDLLDDRLSYGWKPTPSMLATGMRVLGVGEKVPEEGWRKRGEPERMRP